jgi:hypothetical protein
LRKEEGRGNMPWMMVMLVDDDAHPLLMMLLG